MLYLQGAYGVGKQSVAAACARALGLPMLVVDGRWLAARGEEEFLAHLRLLDREARLQGALVYWEDFDALLVDDRPFHLAAALSVLEARPRPTFLAGDAVWEPIDALHDTAFVRLAAASSRTTTNACSFGVRSLGGDGVDLEAVASMFRLTGGQIRDAAATARSLARARQPADPHVTDADLLAACRLQSNPKLAQLAQKLTPHYTWDDIVLPADQLAQLREIANQVRYRALVYDAWGFGAKLALGKGINVLFAGPPGTGKTMAADVLAVHPRPRPLQDRSVRRWSASTSARRRRTSVRIFAEATTSNAILFFDEADALFGKRTQVRDAHDRYANVEISYLLQRMEEYEGVVILATNLRQNMDEAFVRRLALHRRVPASRRGRPPAHLGAHLAGGHAARRRPRSRRTSPSASRWPAATSATSPSPSAFLAAADGGTVSMRHVVARRPSGSTRRSARC